MVKPELIAAIGDHEAANHAAHAVADEDDFFAEGELLLDGIELMPHDRRGIGIGITAGIAIEPKLVVLPDEGIAAQGICLLYTSDAADE